MTMFARNAKEREALSEKSVMLVGCGSVGSALAEMLVRAGVEKLTLVDPDTLAEENLSRHMLTRADLGQPKVKAMAAKLLDINPDCRIEARATGFERVAEEDFAGRSVFAPMASARRPEAEKPDLIVSAVDSYRCQGDINSWALERKVPAVYVGCWGAASSGEILYVVPGNTGCYQCFASFRAKADIPVDPRKYTDPEFDDTRVTGQPGLWANILVIAGLAFQVMLGLLGARPAVIDLEHTLFLVNITDFDSPLRPMAVTFAKVRKGCAVCDVSRLSELAVGHLT